MNTGSARAYTVAIVGGGIHGMHILDRLLTSSAFTGESDRRILVLDRHPLPFHLWRSRSGNCRMRFLRSLASHGVGSSFHALRRRAHREGRTDDWYVPPYHRPALSLFDRHLEDIAALCDDPRVDWFTGVLSSIRKRADHVGFSLLVDPRTESIEAEQVVLALGQPAPYVPPSFLPLYPGAWVDHVHRDGFDPSAFRAGDSVLVVGGGIAAAHLIQYYLSQPVDVAWWYRDPLTVHQFDSDPCFVGPRCRSLWDSLDDPVERRALISRSRRAGSVPPDLAAAVFDHLRRGRLFMIRGEAHRCMTAGRRIVVLGSAGTRQLRYEVDRVVLATGFRGGIPSEELFSHLAESLQLPRASDGYPIVDQSLSWTDRLFLSGAPAELELGPPARNIIGAHLAGRRIVPSILRCLEGQNRS